MKSLFKKTTKPYYKYSQKTLLEDSLHILRTNINMVSMEKGLRTITVTSAEPAEGKTTLTMQLGMQYTHTHRRVLVVNGDGRAPTLERYLGIKAKAGLSDLVVKFFAEPITRGSVLNYGLVDLVLLIYFQGKTGFLTLKDYAGYTVNLYFEGGVLCDIQTPEGHLTQQVINSLTALQKIEEKDVIPFIERSKKVGLPFPSLLLEFGICSEPELKNLLRFELLGLFRELMEKKFIDFEFNDKSVPGYKRIADLFKDDPITLSENLKAIDYITSQLNQYIVPTNHKNLYCLPAGEMQMRLSELFTEGRLKKLLSVLFKHYDMIIFDSPPLSVGVEATILGSITDGTLMVVRSNYTHRQKIKKAIAQLKQAKANLLGVVLNGVSTRSRYGYEYKYIHSYGTKAET